MGRGLQWQIFCGEFLGKHSFSNPYVNWYKTVWFFGKLLILKTSRIHMASFQKVVVFYGQDTGKSQSHLLLSFSTREYGISPEMSVIFNGLYRSWEYTICWMIHSFRDKSLLSMKTTFATIYIIWRQKNSRTFHKRIRILVMCLTRLCIVFGVSSLHKKIDSFKGHDVFHIRFFDLSLYYGL
jgi:hypothetical protein